MIIRTATDRDWPLIYQLFSTIVAGARAYAYPEGVSDETRNGHVRAEPIAGGNARTETS
jgi:hypothetical protein